MHIPGNAENQPSPRTKRLAFAASLAAVGIGLTMLGVPAFADTSATIKLTMVDDDTLAVSGKHFTANSVISVKAKTPDGHGQGMVEADVNGRILLGFRLSPNFSGHIDVVATGAPPASIDVGGITAGSNPPAPAVSTKPAPAPAAAAGTDSDTGGAGTGSVSLGNALMAIPGAQQLQAKITNYNSQMTTTNSLSTLVNNKLTTMGVSGAKYNSQISAMNAQFKTLNDQVGAANKQMTSLNDKASAAKSQTQISQLAPIVAQLNTSYAGILTTTAQVATSVNNLATSIGVTGSGPGTGQTSARKIAA